LNSIEEADIPHCTIATLGKSEKITLIQVFPPKELGWCISLNDRFLCSLLKHSWVLRCRDVKKFMGWWSRRRGRGVNIYYKL